MVKLYEGNLVGTGLKVAIASARWNDFMGGKLLEGAKDALIRHGGGGRRYRGSPGSG